MLAKIICIEGTEGLGKTTQVENLYQHLTHKGFKVLKTKEPGTYHLPITMQMRSLMLDSQYDDQLTREARELISQAIRSVHVQNLLVPALKEYDYIIQDRGALSGLAYGVACGNDEQWLFYLMKKIVKPLIDARGVEDVVSEIYDSVVYLSGNVSDGLNRAISSKKEFEAGDAMESRGTFFMEEVQKNMERFGLLFGANRVAVDGRNEFQVLTEILSALKMER